MKKLTQDQLSVLVFVAIIVVIILFMSIITACAKDEDRITYEFRTDTDIENTYVVVKDIKTADAEKTYAVVTDIKNDYRAGWFCNDTITIPSKYQKFTVMSIERFLVKESKKIIISEGITIIGKNAFNDCTSVEEVIIPSTIKAIGDNAFNHCSNLIDIKFNGTVSQWDAISKGDFWNCNIPAIMVICIDGEVELPNLEEK